MSPSDEAPSTIRTQLAQCELRMHSPSSSPSHLRPDGAPPSEETPMSLTATDYVFPIRSFAQGDLSLTQGIVGPCTTNEHPSRSHKPIVAHASITSQRTSTHQKITSPSFDTKVSAHEPMDNNRLFSEGKKPGTAGAGSSVKGAIGDSQGAEPQVQQISEHATFDGGYVADIGYFVGTLQRDEDEKNHIPGAIQRFGLLVALEHNKESGALPVRIISENSEEIIGKSPQQMFALTNFLDILPDDQAEQFIDHIDLMGNDQAEVAESGPEVFVLSLDVVPGRSRRLWCAMHKNDANPGLIICEFEVEAEQLYPLVPSYGLTPEPIEGTLNDSRNTRQSFDDGDKDRRYVKTMSSKWAGRSKNSGLQILNAMSQVQERLAAATSLQELFELLTSIVKELAGFHRVMVYEFDALFNGRVVAELGEPIAGQTHFEGLTFPASDIPTKVRELHKLNKVRVLYDREMETAQLVYRTAKDLENPLDLTHSFLRAMPPINMQYLGNMAVRSSMTISINGPIDLWGLIICHSYGSQGMRVSFPSRKMCRFIGEEASRNIERLSNESRMQAWDGIKKRSAEQKKDGFETTSAQTS